MFEVTFTIRKFPYVCGTLYFPQLFGLCLSTDDCSHCFRATLDSVSNKIDMSPCWVTERVYSHLWVWEYVFMVCLVSPIRLMRLHYFFKAAFHPFPSSWNNIPSMWAIFDRKLFSKKCLSSLAMNSAYTNIPRPAPTFPVRSRFNFWVANFGGFIRIAVAIVYYWH